jgi:membrane protein
MEDSLERRADHRLRAGQALTFGEKLFRLLRETAIKWNAAKAQRLGAALAYYTVFSLAPLLILAIVISGAIFGQAAAQERIVGQIGNLMGPAGAAGVASLIAQKPFPGQSGSVATIVSVLTLMFGAIGVFGQLQDAFNTVWEVTPPPAKGIVGIVRRHLMPFGMVLAVGFLLLVATLLNTALAAVSLNLGPRVPYFGLLNTALNVVLPILVATLLFAALFRFVPAVHPAWRDLWPGAVLTAVFFTLGKIGIGLYLGHTSLGNASGAAGSLLVVLVWVYYSAQIVLFGAVFTHVYIRYHGQPPVLDPGARPATITALASAGLTAGQAAPMAGPALLTRPSPPPTDVPPQPGCLGALLGFVAGVGAGAMLALRNKRHSSKSVP